MSATLAAHPHEDAHGHGESAHGHAEHGHHETPISKITGPIRKALGKVLAPVGRGFEYLHRKEEEAKARWVRPFLQKIGLGGAHH